MRTRLAAAALVVTGLSVCDLTACAHSDHTGGKEQSTTSAGELEERQVATSVGVTLDQVATTAIGASRAHGYDSLDELRHEAKVVAVVRATDSKSIETVGRIPFTVTAVKVLTPVGESTTAGTTLLVRETGDGTAAAEDQGPILSAGSEYLLFLTPFTFSDGKDTGQWVIIGVSAGKYAKADDGSFLRTSDTDNLPSRISESELAELAPLP